MVLFDVGVYDSAKEVAIVLAVGGVVATSAEVLPGLVMSGPLGLLVFFYLERKVAAGLKGLDIVTAVELGISFYKVEEWDNTNL